MKVLLRLLSVVLVLELILLFGGLLPAEVAAPLVVLTEATAFALGGSFMFRAIAQVRERVGTGERVYVAIERSLADALPPQALFMVKHEIGVFISLGRLIVFRKDLPEDATEIRYGNHMRLFMGILIAASVVEIVAVELLIPWDVVRWVVLFLSVYGLFWIVGLLGATIVYPHCACDGLLVIRFFHFHTIAIPLAEGLQVRFGESSARENKTIELHDGNLRLNVLGSTNLTVALPEPTLIDVDGTPTEARSVSFSVDDPEVAKAAILAAVRSVAEEGVRAAERPEEREALAERAAPARAGAPTS